MPNPAQSRFPGLEKGNAIVEYGGMGNVLIYKEDKNYSGGLMRSAVLPDGAKIEVLNVDTSQSKIQWLQSGQVKVGYIDNVNIRMAKDLVPEASIADLEGKTASSKNLAKMRTADSDASSINCVYPSPNMRLNSGPGAALKPGQTVQILKEANRVHMPNGLEVDFSLIRFLNDDGVATKGWVKSDLIQRLAETKEAAKK